MNTDALPYPSGKTLDRQKSKSSRKEAEEQLQHQGTTKRGKEDVDEGVGAAGTIQEVYTYTQRFLLRVYPAGWRIASG